MIQKKQFTRFSILCFVVLPAIALAPGSVFADKKIDVTVVAGTAGDKIVFQNSECPAEPGNKGCIKTGKGVKNFLKWELDRNSMDEGWVLSGLRLKIDQLPQDTRACAIHDFNLDPGTGDAMSFNNGKVKNDNDCHTGYEVAYELYAEIPGTNRSADSDPVIRNEGKR